MKKDESRNKFAKRQTALNVCVGMVYVMMTLKISEMEELYLPFNSNRNLRRGCDCREQPVQNDFEVREFRSSMLYCWFQGLKQYVL